MTTTNVQDPSWDCPRCGGDIPQPGRRGAYLGAQSRTDQAVMICSPCGDEEAWQDHAGCLTPQSDWPIPADKLNPRRVPTGPVTGWKDTWEENRGATRQPIAPPPIPREVPNLRLHLLERWIPGGPFEKTLYVRGLIHNRELQREAEGERYTLRNASLWWIRDEMVDLTISAARTMPEDLLGSEVVMPDGQEWGFAVLGKPWVGLDADTHGNKVRVSAITWAPIIINDNPCISVCAYQYLDFAGGLRADELNQAMLTGAITESHIEQLVHAGGTASDGEIRGRLRGGAWIYLGRSDWPLRDPLDGPSDVWETLPVNNAIPGLPDLSVAERRASLVEDRRFFSAFAFLVNHKLSQTEVIYSQRQTRRQAERAGVPKAEPSHVRLIKLREIARSRGETDADYEKRKVEYSHRWIVTGHMAWRACGPKHSQRRRVYIAPYPKGPEEMPLIIKEDVRVWDR